MSGFVDSIIFPGGGRNYSGSHSKGLIWLKNQYNHYFPSHFIRKKSRIVILFAHGNGGTLGDFRVIAALYAKYFNASVFSIEYPGYGPAQGEASESSVNSNYQTAYNFLVSTAGYPSGNIVLMGYSIGTGPAIKLAGDLCTLGTPPSAVITIAAFMSIIDIVKDMKGRLFFNQLIAHTINNRWDSMENIKNVTCPVLLLHGMLDPMIPYNHSKSLYSNCPSNTKVLRLIPAATHDKFQEPTDTIKPIAQFLKDCSHLCMKRLVLQKIPPDYYKCPKDVIEIESTPQYGGCGSIAACGGNDTNSFSIFTDAVSGSFEWIVGTFDYITMNSAAVSANHPVEVTEDYEFEDDAHSRATEELNTAVEHVIFLPTPTKAGEKVFNPLPSDNVTYDDKIEDSKELKGKEEHFLNNVKVLSTPDPKRSI